MRPYIIVFSTMTLDGRIADPTGFSMLSCEEDFVQQHWLRAAVDGVMVGSRTAIIDNPRLTVRLVKGRSPYRIVVDSKLKVSPSSRMFEVPGKGIILTTVNHSQEDIKRYREKGIRVIAVGSGRVDLRKAMEILYHEYSIRRLMVEGGGGLNCALLKKRLIDEIHVTVSPIIFGAGVSLFHGKQTCRASLSLLEYRPVCGGWIHMRYKVFYGE